MHACFDCIWAQLTVAYSELKANPNLSSYLLYYAEACNEFAGLISALLRLRATQLLSKKMSQRWRAVGNTVSTLTSLRFYLTSELPLQRRTRYRSTNRPE